jgi:hypothetical protein
MSSKDIDIKEFAIRVERLCEFILDQMDEKTGSAEQILIQNLREDAANIQFNPRLYGDISLRGLDDHIRGIVKSE